MGILSALLGANNPAAIWAAQNRGWLGSVGAGLGSGTSFSDGLARAAEMGPQGMRVDDAYRVAEEQKAERQRAINETSEYLRSTFPDLADAVNAGMPLDAAWSEAMKRSQPGYGVGGDNLMSVGGHLYDKATGQWISPPATDNRQNVSLTPQWGQDAEGNWVMLQPSSTGELVKSAVPEGISLVNPFDLNAQKAGGTTFGKQTGDAQFSLPAMEKELDQSLASIKKLSEADITAGKDEWFGQVGALPRGMWVQGGSNMAKFQVAANNVIDRSWLSARAMLKGGGPITDYESNKAENAVSMMKGALEKGDKKTYDDAVVEYEYWIKQGFAKLQQQAGAMPGYGGGTPAPSGNTTSSGVTWKVK